MLQGVTGSFKGLERVREGYKELQGVTGGTRGYRELEGLTGGFKGLQGVTEG